MQERYTPIHCASNNGHRKIVEQLLTAGANHSAVNDVRTYPNMNNCTKIT